MRANWLLGHLELGGGTPIGPIATLGDFGFLLFLLLRLVVNQPLRNKT